MLETSEVSKKFGNLRGLQETPDVFILPPVAA